MVDPLGEEEEDPETPFFQLSKDHLAQQGDLLQGLIESATQKVTQRGGQHEDRGGGGDLPPGCNATGGESSTSSQPSSPLCTSPLINTDPEPVQL